MDYTKLKGGANMDNIVTDKNNHQLHNFYKWAYCNKGMRDSVAHIVFSSLGITLCGRLTTWIEDDAPESSTSHMCGVWYPTCKRCMKLVQEGKI